MLPSALLVAGLLASVTVTVVDERDRALPGAKVEMLQLGQVKAHAFSNRQGVSEFGGLQPGSYYVRVSLDGFTTREVLLVASPDSPAATRVILPDESLLWYWMLISQAPSPSAGIRCPGPANRLEPALSASGESSGLEEGWVPVGFVVLKSTSDYGEARRVVDVAAQRLDIPVDLRKVEYDPEHGLTFPRDVCEADGGFPYPCYVARGRYDAGVYLSIERSDAYRANDSGCFSVIVASGDPSSPELAAALKQVRVEYPDAYVKSEKVYHGCIH
ncbi:MAG: carboxypeptidase regulatory-like domain-containing protein [Thermoanaerobaculia bacterium]|nr:carboxypeptidase regulatory-like domain-containing protein [Thermoanaerobaculia bacterium]MBP9823094.1 carboxypeptidase regulatory-like domain-containing protein [Thermoanaerobaculia bacterium]